MKATIRAILAMAATVMSFSAHALDDKDRLPHGYERACGKVTSIERSRTYGEKRIWGQDKELVAEVGIQLSANFAIGFSVDRNFVNDELAKRILLQSLGKKVCIDFQSDSRFWIQSIELQSE